MSNDPTGNAVFAFDRATDGTLTPRDVYFTGGTGSGDGLGNQSALVYSASRDLLFAVNAGDSSISTFVRHPDGSLMLLSKVGSGGVRPVSVTVSGDLVYTVNAGNAATPGNISGFRIAAAGLVTLAGSTQPLSAALTGPAQIAFNASGKVLIVSEKGTNKLDTYVVGATGIVAAPSSQASVGVTPFGFAFGAGGQLIVSEAVGGAANASTATSYAVSDTGALAPISSAVPSSQSAACWVAVAGTHAYVSNTKSNNLSTYTVGANGSLTLVGTGVGATTGMGPTDSAVTPSNDFLYVLDSPDAALSSFAIAGDGTLTAKPDFAGLPQHATGLVAL